jgi:phosphoacetylglucosamine mutase
MLHYIVRCMNTKGKGDLEEYGVPTTRGYYEKMVSSFRKLVVSSHSSLLLSL